MIGKRFGRLVVLKRDDSSKRRIKYICRCDCGEIKSIQKCHLLSGATQSCGCLQKERARESNLKHNGRKEYKRLYNIWKNMRKRCNNPNNIRYKDYGGRGIKICNEWDNFEEFKDWSLANGYSDNLEIDRIDNNKGYSPDNCRWVTTKTNNRNRRNTAVIIIDNKEISLGLIEEIFDKYNVILYSKRYKDKKIKIRSIYNQLKKSNEKVTMEQILENCICMGIPSRAYSEMIGRCND